MRLPVENSRPPLYAVGCVTATITYISSDLLGGVLAVFLVGLHVAKIRKH
jgi:hypothetical protein